MKVIDTDLFIHTIADIHKNDDHRKFCFVLGAGASYGSGIKTGNHLAKEWFIEIEKIYQNSQSVFDDWIKEQKIDIKKLGISYGSIYRKRFENDKNSGYDSLANAMKDANPSYGYIILAQILTKSSGHCIVTTNFDSLIEASIFQYTNKTPLVCGHESLSAYARPHQTHPLIVKIHRDLLLSPKSDPDEISKLDPAWQTPLDAIFSTHIPIVIGYGGNDEGLMSYFEGMKTPSNFFWCDLNTDNLTKRVVSLIEKHDGKFVGISGFDELMHEFGHAFEEINLQDKMFEDIANERTKNIKKQKRNINLQKELSDKDKKLKSFDARKNNIKALSALEYGDLIDKEENKESKKLLYKQALLQYPEIGWLWTSYSYFLHYILDDKIEAEEAYTNALKYNPKDIYTKRGFAIFTDIVKKEYSKAEQYYLEALKLEPLNVDSNLDYANFLNYSLREWDKAESYFETALIQSANDAIIITSYASFLYHRKKDNEKAEKYFKEALAIDSTNPNVNINYAIFLSAILKKPSEAEQYFIKALEREKENIEFNRYYAQHLFEQGEKIQSERCLKFGLASKEENTTILECWFLQYACNTINLQDVADKIEELLAKGIRTDDWDFSDVIKQAKTEGHPNIEKLQEFAKLMNERL
jgi:protein O-mannosyl-transferase